MRNLYDGLCTMLRAVWLYHEDKSLTPPIDFNLQSHCESFGVRLLASSAHDALVDVRTTVELYWAMMGQSHRKA